jgi:DNA-binding transcriptional MerR regulator
MLNLFGWGWKIRRLRKRWDRLREKSLRKEPAIRTVLLPKEDQIEQNLRILEERRLNRRERARIAKEVEIDLAEVKAILKSKPEELRESRAPAPTQTEAPQQQQREIQKRREREQGY